MIHYQFPARGRKLDSEIIIQCDRSIKDSLPIPRKGTETMFAAWNARLGLKDSLPIPRKGTETLHLLAPSNLRNLEDSLPIPRKGTETRAKASSVFIVLG